MKYITVVVITLIVLKGFPQSGFQVYYGNLHSHTSFSDGMGTPYDAYTFARDSAHIDFLAVTDHVEWLSWNNFNTGLQTADALTVDGSFIALYGYEWTSNNYGHCSILYTDEMITASSSSFYPGGWELLTAFVQSHPPAMGQFNHPGRYSWFNNWNNFAYVNGATDTCFPMIEFQDIAQADYYVQALLNGWHVTPVWNQDNHYADWGLKNDGRAGIWAAALSKNDLRNAIMHRRTFATMDKNASVWIEYGTYPMGSIVPVNLPAQIRCVLNDQDNELWTKIEIVTSNGIIDSLTGPLLNPDTLITLSDTLNWIFIKATQPDGDILWSAPLFFDVPASAITTTDQSVVPSDVFYREGEIILHPGTASPSHVTISDLTGRCLQQNKIAMKKGNREEFVIHTAVKPPFIISVRNSDGSVFSKPVIF